MKKPGLSWKTSGIRTATSLNDRDSTFISIIVARTSSRNLWFSLTLELVPRRNAAYRLNCLQLPLKHTINGLDVQFGFLAVFNQPHQVDAVMPVKHCT